MSSAEYRASFADIANDPVAQERARKLLKRLRKRGRTGEQLPASVVAYLRLTVAQRSRDGMELRCA